MDDDTAAALAYRAQLEEEQEHEMNMIEKLAAIQQELNAPKNQVNKFGGYNYRSCEDILMAVKPLLNGLILTITDEIVAVGDRVYVKATATITDGSASLSSTAFAREAASKKGMDDAQVTGSTSSYARKYALNGLLLIDDNKDADHHDNRESAQAESKPKPEQRPAFSLDIAKSVLEQITTLDELKAKFATFWTAAPEAQRAALKKAYDAVKANLEEEKEPA